MLNMGGWLWKLFFLYTSEKFTQIFNNIKNWCKFALVLF